MPPVIVHKDGITCGDQFVDDIPVSSDIFRVTMDHVNNGLGHAVGEPRLPVKGKSTLCRQSPFTCVNSQPYPANVQLPGQSPGRNNSVRFQMVLDRLDQKLIHHRLQADGESVSH